MNTRPMAALSLETFGGQGGKGGIMRLEYGMRQKDALTCRMTFVSLPLAMTVVQPR